MRERFWIAAVALILILFPLLSATAAPTLLGRVVDQLGRSVANATIHVRLADGTTTESKTDNRGSFRLDVAESFQLEIRHPDFRTVQIPSVRLTAEDVYQIVIPLIRGDSNDIERVDLDLAQTDDVQSRGDPSVREGLPKSDRLFGLRGGVNVSGIAEGSGQQWVAASGNVFTSSSIGANAVEASDFSADLGDYSTLDDSLPSGTNAFHGNVHYFHRNDKLNARNYFDPQDRSIPPFKYHFFGGDVGGRLNERTYFYLQYWGLRIHQSITRAATVPEPAWLTGDFSSLNVNLIDPATGFAFTGNRIPRSRFDPLGLSFAQMFPTPNVAGATIQNYRAVGKLKTSADSFGFRFDHRLTSADEAFLEYQFNRDTTVDPFNLLSGITNLPSYGVRDALRTHSIRLNNTHVFSPSLIQEVRGTLGFLTQPRSILEKRPLPAVLITGLSNLGHATNLPQERRNRSVELLTDLSWQHARSLTKIGGAVRYFPFEASLDLYSRGQFQFTGGIFTDNAFANLLLGLPTNALRIEGDTSRKFTTWTTSLYVQHDVRLLPNLVVNGGLRYDFQSPFRETQDRVANFDAMTGTLQVAPDRLYEPDRNNWAPRVGIAWQPGVLKNVLVRAGYGVFFDTLAVGDSLFLLGLNPPFVRFDVQNNGPVIPLFDFETAFDRSSTTIHPSIFSTSRRLPNPYIQQWSLTLEKPIRDGFQIELSYFGQKGTRLRRQLNLNQPTPGPAGTLDDRRPFVGFKNIFQFETSASSIAHAAEVRAVRGFHDGIGIVAAYRFSRAIDDATLISVLPQNSHNLKAERGLADFHMKHRLVFSATYDLPAWRYIQSWQVQAIGTLQSGTPLSAILGADVAGTGSPIVNRPNLIRDPNVSNPTSSRFFDPGAFQAPASGTFGNSGRNVIIGPGTWNMDMSLSRNFRISDLTRTQVRADFYNIFNHSTFVAPPSTQNFADSPDFGALFVARSPRILQLGVKFLW
jgi:hypothetical protein